MATSYENGYRKSMQNDSQKYRIKVKKFLSNALRSSVGKVPREDLILPPPPGEGIFFELVEFHVLFEIHVSKTRFKQINENLRLNVYARMLWEPVYINNWEKSGVLPTGFSSFGAKLSLLASVILYMICYPAFSLWFGFINTCLFFGSNTMNCLNFATLFKASLALSALLVSIVAEAPKEPAKTLLL